MVDPLSKTRASKTNTQNKTLFIYIFLLQNIEQHKRRIILKSYIYTWDVDGYDSWMGNEWLTVIFTMTKTICKRWSHQYISFIGEGQ